MIKNEDTGAVVHTDDRGRSSGGSLVGPLTEAIINSYLLIAYNCFLLLAMLIVIWQYRKIQDIDFPSKFYS